MEVTALEAEAREPNLVSAMCECLIQFLDKSVADIATSTTSSAMLRECMLNSLKKEHSWFTAFIDYLKEPLLNTFFSSQPPISDNLMDILTEWYECNDLLDLDNDAFRLFWHLQCASRTTVPGFTHIQANPLKIMRPEYSDYRHWYFFVHNPINPIAANLKALFGIQMKESGAHLALRTKRMKFEMEYYRWIAKQNDYQLPNCKLHEWFKGYNILYYLAPTIPSDAVLRRGYRMNARAVWFPSAMCPVEHSKVIIHSHDPDREQAIKMTVPRWSLLADREGTSGHDLIRDCDIVIAPGCNIMSNEDNDLLELLMEQGYDSSSLCHLDNTLWYSPGYDLVVNPVNLDD